MPPHEWSSAEKVLALTFKTHGYNLYVHRQTVPLLGVLPDTGCIPPSVLEDQCTRPSGLSVSFESDEPPSLGSARCGTGILDISNANDLLLSPLQWRSQYNRYFGKNNQLCQRRDRASW